MCGLCYLSRSGNTCTNNYYKAYPSVPLITRTFFRPLQFVRRCRDNQHVPNRHSPLMLALAVLACQPTGNAVQPQPEPEQATAQPQKGALIPLNSNLYGRFHWAQDAPELGDVAPDFTLPLVDGSTFNLAEARADGDVVVVFYRGFW